MAGRLSGAMVVIVAIVVAFRFSFVSVSDTRPTDLPLGTTSAEMSPTVAGIRASRTVAKFQLGQHPGRGHGLVRRLTPTTATTPSSTTAPAVVTTAASSTTAAPATTASTSTSLAPSTTLAPITTVAPPTTISPTTTAVVATTAVVTTTSQATGAPTGSVTLQAGANIQSVVDSKPAGSTFYLLAGVYRGQTVKPRNGDTFIGQPGAVLDGENRTEMAFRSSASNVTIKGLVIENYANPAQSGAVGGGGGSNWAILGNEIRYNWGAGVVLGNGFVVKANNVHHNRQIGIKGSGSNILIEGNEIAYNNYRFDYNYTWESGGTKFLYTTNLVVRGNYVHNNRGNGLWTDADNVNTLYENNVVVNNEGTGIFHEISYDAVIRNNRIEGNAFPHTSGGIKITGSANVEVYGNTLTGNDGGFHISQSARPPGNYGAHDLKNLWVHDNVLSFSSGWTGLRVNDGLGDSYYNSMNNRFDRNSYRIAGLAEPFYWMGDERTWDQWKAFGQDVNGSHG